ncbi:MAG: hypothetical protein Q4B60_00450 [Erysipelotrichaceae bacterium]|nr:hypothetical protein [Erysipelotrichaceae bacterium]
MNNIIRLLLLSIYPIIILLSGLIVYRKYKDTLRNNYKNILFNSLLAAIIIAVGLVVFFKKENTIYAYDYAGHWIRALTLRLKFFENPKEILPLVYSSMNNMDYSFLPALFGLPFILLNQSYTFFALTNLLIFLLPTFVLLQIAYFKYLNKNRYIPLVTLLVVYPLYLTLFYGKVDCSGLLFITLGYLLVILPDFKEIDNVDNLAVNLFMFLAIFLRRWYLYSAVCFYLSYFIKWLFHKEKKFTDLFKLLSSGIVLLIVCLLFFRPFMINTLTNNFDEAYAFYNHDGKILSFINNISPIICVISVIGLFVLFKKDRSLLVINIVSIVVPCLMIWKIQSFEYHHYYIFLLNIIILFVIGIEYLSKVKYAQYLLIVLLLIQPLTIFTYMGNNYIFTNIRKNPEVLENKYKLMEISEYIKSVEPDDTFTAFLSGGAYGIITDDLLRNAMLPDIDFPNIDSAVFDIRDGFPKDYQYIKYIITVDPMVYTDRNYQHMFDIISDAIINYELISSIYHPIYENTLETGHNITVYERISDYTPEMKKYFYNEMLKYYPDKADYFSYILD